MSHYVLDARTATPHFPGIGRYVHNLSRALVPFLETDEHLTVLQDPQYPVMLPERAMVTPVMVGVSPFSLSQQWIVPRLLLRLDADLYHSPYYQMPYVQANPAICTVHDLIPMRLPAYSSWRTRQIFHLLVSLALRTSAHVITGSEAARRDLFDRFPISQDRITVIPYAADPMFRPLPAESVRRLRRRLDLPENFALYVGSNKPHKNLVRLVEAWPAVAAVCPRTTLVIAGMWEPRYDKPKAVAATLGLGPEQVRWLGPVDGNDLPPLYSAATLFVFPSLYEGFGLPVIEAMACGIPVACSNASSLPEVVGDAALLFDPEDPVAISLALIRLFQDATLRETLSEQSLAQSARFSWGRAARETIALYRSTLGLPEVR